MPLSNIRIHTLASTISAVLLASIFALPAQAADLGSDCCGDLEERIAELEATTARKGNRKIGLTVYGHINESIMVWDDGQESNAYVTDNQNDQSHFGFAGDAHIRPDWIAGYSIVVRLQDSLSGEVSQESDDTDLANFLLWESNVFIESKTWGRVTMGLASRVSDGAPEHDLSETALAGYAGVQDIGGGMALRRSSDNTLIGVSWGDLYSHFNGDTANLIHYDTPEFAGFVANVSWGEDDIWDVGLTYGGTFGGIVVSGAIAYSESTDGNGVSGDPGEPESSVVVGSIALLHEPSGLNVLVAAARQSFDNPVVDTDGPTRNVEDVTFVYTKLGLITHLNSLGHTAFFGEYGYFQNFVSAGADAALVGDLDGSGGTAVRITGNEATVWGGGVVQHIDAAEMDIYLGYRYHEADFDLVNGAGAGVTTTGLEGFHTLIVGTNITF